MKIPKTCFECEGGPLEAVVEDFSAPTSAGNEITVPKVTVVRCGSCGETFIPAESGRCISRYVTEAREQLKTAALTASSYRKSGIEQEGTEVTEELVIP